MFKKIVTASVLTSMAFVNFANAATFPNGVMWDVKTNHSLYKYMDKMVSEGIIGVYNDGSFKSEEKVNRNQAARYIYNALVKANYTGVNAKVGKVASKPFPDVATDDFYAFYIQELKNAGMIAGYANGTYGGNNNLTRGEMLAILEAARKKADPNFTVPDYKSNPSSIPTSHRFGDVKIDNVFFNYIYNALSLGYVTNNPNFEYNRHVTKAEMAAMLNNVLYAPVKELKSNTATNPITPDEVDAIKGTTKTSQFYKGTQLTLTSAIKTDTNKNRFALIIDTRSLGGKIPYINKNNVKFTVDGKEVKVSKITLLKNSVGEGVIYGVYTSEEIDTTKPMVLSYVDTNVKVEAKLNVKEEGTKTETPTNTNTGTTDTSTNTGTTTGEVEIALASDTPKSTIIPANATGVEVAKYRITAKEGDVVISKIDVKRNGLSDADTLTAVAIYDENGRISRVRNDSQENHTVAALNLISPLKIKSGETKEITVVVSLGASSVASNDRFGLSINALDTGKADAKFDFSKTRTEEFIVAGTDAPVITVKAGSTISTTPKVGMKSADIQNIEIEGDRNLAAKLNKITLRGINSDTTKSIANPELYLDGKKVATGTIHDHYVSFKLDKLEVESSKTLRFTIKADIVDGANKSLGFYIDSDLDVSGIYNDSYNIKANIEGLDDTSDVKQTTVEAGQLAIITSAPTSDTIRENKDAVEIGKFEVNNTSGGNIELQKFGVKIQLNPGQASIGSKAEGTLNLAEALESVYLQVDNGSKIELTKPKGSETTFVYSDINLSNTLKQGKTSFKILVDTANNINKFNTASFNLSLTTGDLSNTTGGFYAVETSGNQPVRDITPSSISFTKIDGSESSAKVALLPLASISKVRGAKDVPMLTFEVKADPSGAINIDEITASLEANGQPANSSSISEVALFKKEVKPENLLDRKSGSGISNGKISFNAKKTKINASSTETFVVAVSLVDTPEVVNNSPIKAKLEDVLMLDDSNNKNPYLEGVLTSSRVLSVKASGNLLLTQDINNLENRHNKTILAGNSEKIFSVDVQASDEPIKVEELSFTVDKNITKAIQSASLYLGGTKVATNSYSDNVVEGTNTVIKFERLSNLIIPQETKELTLELNTNTIGYEKVGEVVSDFKVTKIKLVKGKGNDSSVALSPSETVINSSKFTSISSSIINVVAKERLNNGLAKLELSLNAGNNSIATSNAKPQAKLKRLTFTEISGNSDGYTVYREGEAGQKLDIPAGQNFVDFSTWSDHLRTISSGAVNIFIVPKGTTGKTYSISIPRDGLEVELINPDGSTIIASQTAGLTNEIDLGSKTY